MKLYRSLNIQSNKIIKLIAIIVAVVATLMMIIPSIQVSAAKYKDINGHWAQKAVEYLSNKNIISGYPDGTFKPNNTITVQEFLKMVVVAKGYELPKTDSNWLGWATKYAAAAQINGLFNNSEFYYGSDYIRPITRYEMARIVARALKDEQYPPVYSEFTAKIKDYNKIPDNLKEYVYIAFVKGIISGFEDGEFKGQQNATRAQAAIMIQHLIDKSSREYKVKYYGTDPENDYIEPWDLIRKLIEMELNGQADEVLQYITKESRNKFNIQTGEKYLKGGYVSDNCIAGSLGEYIRKSNNVKKPGNGYEVKCMPVYMNENKISMKIQYYVVYSGEVDKGDQHRIKHTMYRVDGLWYVDLQEEPMYRYESFMYDEGI